MSIFKYISFLARLIFTIVVIILEICMMLSLATVPINSMLDFFINCIIFHCMGGGLFAVMIPCDDNEYPTIFIFLLWPICILSRKIYRICYIIDEEEINK